MALISCSTEPIRTPKSAEYEIFAKVTASLRTAVSVPERISAISDNRQLWIALATDVASDGNTLPSQLRARIFYLSEFVSHHSRKLLASEDELDVLIDINTTIMGGLRQKAVVT